MQPPAAEAFIGSRQLETLERSILHEDDKLLVINKPAGIAVHGGSGVSFGVIEGLRRLRPQCSLELVHRLDRETSGCLLVSKRRSMLRSLHELIRSGALGKEYLMIVRGNWPATLKKVDAPLHKYLTASGERRVKVSPEGKPSLTSFEVLAGAPDATLLKAELHTGRTHQLRVHCLHAGHGILGDDKYASEAERAEDRARGIQRLCLHAERIVLPDGLVYTAPVPGDLLKIWHALGGRDGSDSAGPATENG
jgi:23S rRNA pseudouridine955/2504/2580 synthase